MLYITLLEGLGLKNIQNVKVQNIGLSTKKKFYKKNHKIQKTIEIIIIKIRTPNK